MQTSVPRRTVTDIRTLSSRRLGHGASAREKYLRLAKLEFERKHFTNHLQKAREHARGYEERLARNGREQGYLLTSAVAARNGEPVPSEVPRRAGPAILGRLGRRVAS